MSVFISGLAAITLGTSIYVWLLNRAMRRTPPEVQKLLDKPWTDEDMRSVYERVKQSPIDVQPFLKPRTGRRYVVIGGSGMVGSWIVQHLLWRGENPAAIRILDLQAPKRYEAVKNNIVFIKTDVTDISSVTVAFETPWPADVANLPLTVFHCVAYIGFRERYSMFLHRYLKVNVEGTSNVIEAAKAAGTSVFVATSSGAVGVKRPSYFIWPGQQYPRETFQVLSAAETREKDTLSSMTNCYAYSKAQAEALVVSAHDPKTNFRTGCIRPCYAIYGHNVHSSVNLVWDYLQRGQSPSWLHGYLGHFVDAENVSIAHLAYEHTLLKQQNTTSSKTTKDVGGKTYYVTDPNPPITYGQLYRFVTTLAHPSTPHAFPAVPPGLMLVLAHLVELYALISTRFLSSLLPPLTGDLATLQPATFNVSAGHYMFDDRDAQRDLGYVAPIRSIEGFARGVLDWNNTVDEKLKQAADSTGGLNVAHTELESTTSIVDVGVPRAM